MALVKLTKPLNECRSYGDYARWNREHRGMTIGALECKSGVPHATIMALERSKNIGISSVELLADAMGITICEYLTACVPAPYSIYSKDYATAMKYARMSKMLTLTDLAARSGINIGCICGYERGKALPRMAGAIALANSLGICVDEYIGHEVENFD